MYAVIILEQALEDLKDIVGYIANENGRAAETLGSELLDAATSLESLPYRGSRVKKRRGLLKTDPRAVSDLLPCSGTEKAC